MFTRSCKFTSFTRQHELEKEFKEPVELDETIVYGKNNIKSCRQEGFDTTLTKDFLGDENLKTNNVISRSWLIVVVKHLPEKRAIQYLIHVNN